MLMFGEYILAAMERATYEIIDDLGFVGHYPGADHEYMSRGLVETRIPNPHGSNISADLLQRILKRAGISREEWFDVA
jgi:hypothetical protein